MQLIQVKRLVYGRLELHFFTQLQLSRCISALISASLFLEEELLLLPRRETLGSFLIVSHYCFFSPLENPLSCWNLLVWQTSSGTGLTDRQSHQRRPGRPLGVNRLLACQSSPHASLRSRSWAHSCFAPFITITVTSSAFLSRAILSWCHGRRAAAAWRPSSTLDIRPSAANYKRVKSWILFLSPSNQCSSPFPVFLMGTNPLSSFFFCSLMVC